MTNIRLPSTSAICGLCAAFFLVASTRMVGDLARSFLLWPHDAALYDWARALAMLLLSVVSPFVGLRLLYERCHCLLHGLLLGWLWLAVTAYNQTTVIYRVSHEPHLWILLPLIIAPVLFFAAVVWLLHTVQSREQGRGDRLPANTQVA